MSNAALRLLLQHVLRIPVDTICESKPSTADSALLLAANSKLRGKGGTPKCGPAIDASTLHKKHDHME